MRGAGNVSLQQRQREGVDTTANTQCDEVVNYSRGWLVINQSHTHTHTEPLTLATYVCPATATSSRSR